MTKPFLARASKRSIIRARLCVWARCLIVVSQLFIFSFTALSEDISIDEYWEGLYNVLDEIKDFIIQINDFIVSPIADRADVIADRADVISVRIAELQDFFFGDEFSDTLGEIQEIRDIAIDLRDLQERIADYQLEVIKDLATSMDTNLVSVYTTLSDFRSKFNDWTHRLQNEYSDKITQLIQSIYHIEALNDSSDLTLAQIYSLLSGGNISAHVSLDSLGEGIDLDSLHFTMKNPFVFDYTYIEYLYDLVSNGSTIYSPQEGERAIFLQWRNRPAQDFSFISPFSPEVNTLYLDNIRGDNFYNDTITFFNNYQSLLNNINDSLIFLCQNLITNADFSANDSELETAQENAESFISSLDFSDISNFDRTDKMGDVVSVLGNFSVSSVSSDHAIQFRSLSIWDFSPSEVITIDYGSEEFSSWLDFVRKMAIGFWWILNISFIVSASFGVYKLFAWLYQTFVNLQSA